MLKITEIDVKLTGMADLMFDRYIDQSKEARPPEQKFYLAEKNQLVIPGGNIKAFLSGQKIQGCAMRFEGKKGRQFAKAVDAHVRISPNLIPITDKQKPIVFDSFENGKFYINKSVPRDPSKGIKIENPGRPVLKIPWDIQFNLLLVENELIDSVKLFNWFVRGGFNIGLLNGRPEYGRFAVDKWKTKEKEI